MDIVWEKFVLCVNLSVPYLFFYLSHARHPAPIDINSMKALSSAKVHL